LILANTLLNACGINFQLAEDVKIDNIQLDSRKILKGGLFLALKGFNEEGSQYISSAVKNGAVLVLCDTQVGHANVSVIYVPHLREKIIEILNVFYGNPLDKVQVIGVTGTNGKSTVAMLIASLLKANGEEVTSFGTINNQVGSEVYAADLTTPDPVELMKLIQRGVELGCQKVVMEVSSHALEQNRVKGLPFFRALFTNLTQDHLDYHLNFEEYYRSKKKLFSYLLPQGKAIINGDSQYGRRLIKEVECEVLSFSQNLQSQEDSLLLVSASLTLVATEIVVSYRGNHYRFTSSLIGRINVENLLSVIGLGFSLNISPDVIATGLKDVKVAGRNEVIPLPNGAVAVVDYAHTPDALERVLKSLKPLIRANLICLFGCGGDRDKTKRPLMGKVASELSDRVVVTSDNPRTEKPELIIEDILKGMTQDKYFEVIEERRQAIQRVLNLSQSGDCVLIAGKGHEDYQIIGREKTYFSDREEVLEWIKENPQSKQVDSQSSTRGDVPRTTGEVHGR